VKSSTADELLRAEPGGPGRVQPLPKRPPAARPPSAPSNDQPSLAQHTARTQPSALIPSPESSCAAFGLHAKNERRHRRNRSARVPPPLPHAPDSTLPLVPQCLSDSHSLTRLGPVRREQAAAALREAQEVLTQVSFSGPYKRQSRRALNPNLLQLACSVA